MKVDKKAEKEVPEEWMELKIKVLKIFRMQLKWKNIGKGILKVLMEMLVISKKTEIIINVWEKNDEKSHA